MAPRIRRRRTAPQICPSSPSTSPHSSSSPPSASSRDPAFLRLPRPSPAPPPRRPAPASTRPVLAAGAFVRCSLSPTTPSSCKPPQDPPMASQATKYRGAVACYFRRKKRPRTLDNPLLPCSWYSSAQIHVKGKSDTLHPCLNAPTIKIHPCLNAPTIKIPFWGAKRARTAVSPMRRDWANLGDGLAGLIAERVLANDVADYVRFRAVCCPWQRCCADPRAAHVGLDPRFHPRRWTMLPDGEHTGTRHGRFLNVSTDQCIWTDLPELFSHHILAVTREGFLLLLQKDTHVVCLLNPVTRHLTELPPVTTLLSPKQIDDARRIHKNFSAWGSGIASDLTVVLYLNNPSRLAVAKPGHDHWTLVNHNLNNERIRSPLMFAGHFYGITNKGVMVLGSTRADQHQPPQLEMAVMLHPLYGLTSTAHLVDNGGKLMLVHRRLRKDMLGCWKRCYDVYLVDLGTRALVPVNSFGGHAVFMGMRFSLSVSPKVFPFVRSDTIYLSFEFTERSMNPWIESYCLADESTEPSTRMARRCYQTVSWTVSAGASVSVLYDFPFLPDIAYLSLIFI